MKSSKKHSTFAVDCTRKHAHYFHHIPRRPLPPPPALPKTKQSYYLSPDLSPVLCLRCLSKNGTDPFLGRPGACALKAGDDTLRDISCCCGLRVTLPFSPCEVTGMRFNTERWLRVLPIDHRQNGLVDRLVVVATINRRQLIHSTIEGRSTGTFFFSWNPRVFPAFTLGKAEGCFGLLPTKTQPCSSKYPWPEHRVALSILPAPR